MQNNAQGVWAEYLFHKGFTAFDTLEQVNLALIKKQKQNSESLQAKLW